MSHYAYPEVVVETAWVAEHLDDPNVRLVESNQDTLLYHTGHIPGAVKLDWFTDLADPLRRDYVDAIRFAGVLAARGISSDTTIVLYGDMYNWWASAAFWVCKLFSHRDVRMMDGGRAKWIAEQRPVTREVPPSVPATYPLPERNDTPIRASREQVLAHIEKPGCVLVDVRSADEYSGKQQFLPEYPQASTLRSGHIPTAINLPWSTLVNEDSTFKTRAEFEHLYQSRGITPDMDIISSCLMGVLSSHTWFVLTYLLGYPRVRNYDGGWTEWGNLVRVPIELGSG